MAHLPLRENIRIAFDAIQTQRLRAILTAFIIGIGIMAMVGMLTATTALESLITGQFSQLGANTFTIQSRGMQIQIGRGGKRPKAYPAITWAQANDFVDQYHHLGALTSLSYAASGTMEVKRHSKSTDPNVAVWAADENYIHTGGYQIAEGRNFSVQDIEGTRPVVILGREVYEDLFGESPAIDSLITMRGQRYRVIGIMAEKGASAIFSGDRAVFIPITKARASITSPSSGYSINVMASSSETLDATIGEATSVMRAVRKLRPIEDDNFNITRSDALSTILLSSKGVIYTAAIAISLITLLVAAINLMNIMLVSVKQRTKEIGTRKALGAKRRTIVVQFLTEAAVISQLGGLLGVILGLIIGNIIGALMDVSFIIPWGWIIFAFFITFITGIVSGLYPAIQAAKLDPIDALRYE